MNTKLLFFSSVIFSLVLSCKLKKTPIRLYNFDHKKYIENFEIHDTMVRMKSFKITNSAVIAILDSLVKKANRLYYFDSIHKPYIYINCYLKEDIVNWHFYLSDFGSGLNNDWKDSNFIKDFYFMDYNRKNVFLSNECKSLSNNSYFIFGDSITCSFGKVKLKKIFDATHFNKFKYGRLSFSRMYSERDSLQYLDQLISMPEARRKNREYLITEGIAYQNLTKKEKRIQKRMLNRIDVSSSNHHK